MNQQRYDEHDLVDFDPTGGPSDVGSGGGFGANLYNLYLAGEVEMPTLAARYLPMVDAVLGASSACGSQAWAAGNPAAISGLVDVMNELQMALRSTCMSLRDCGAVLSTLAQDYAATDRDAAREFNRHVRETGDVDLTSPAPRIPDPPTPNETPSDGPGSGPPPEESPRPPDLPDVELPHDEAPDVADDYD